MIALYLYSDDTPFTDPGLRVVICMAIQCCREESTRSETGGLPLRFLLLYIGAC